MAAATLTLRYSASRGAKVERTRLDSLEAALDALEERMGELARRERREVIDLKVRRFEAVHQIAARGEVAAGRARAGVDLRGDGSLEAFTGRMRRRAIASEAGETAFDAVRRALGVTPA